MVEKAADRIYRIPVPLPGNPLKELNAYVIRGKDRTVLIDTGFRQDPCRQALFEGMAELGLRPGDAEVLLTHLHADHAGLSQEAAGEKGVIWISQVDRPHLGDQEYVAQNWTRTDARFLAEGFAPELLRQIRGVNPARSLAAPVADRYTGLADGQVLELGGFRLQCLLMPGHTPGQMCFWLEEQGILFTGDHVLFDITPNITAWNIREDSLGDYLESLKKIKAYNGALALPGHRKSGDLGQRADQLLEHHRCRLEEALKGIREHPGSTACELAGHMTWKIKARSWEEFPTVQKWFAVGECMSHLDYLLLRGRIRREEDGGLRRYFIN